MTTIVGASCQLPRRIEEQERAAIPELQSTSIAAAPATSKFIRWCKFNLVGGVGIGVQFAALFLFRSILHFDYMLATALAVEAAVVHNFVWHEQFTWAERVQSSWRGSSWRGSSIRLLRFNLTTGAVSILGNLALMRVMVGQGHMNYLLANAFAIALCSLANFLVSEQWVFGE
jgi:putative flippase GtrA